MTLRPSNTVAGIDSTINARIDALDTAKVGKTTNSVVTGLVDFSTLPTLEADPTGSTQAVRKGYVDGKTTTHESTYDHSKLHTRKHAIDSASDHDSISADDGSLMMVSGNALKFSSIKLSDLIFISGTQPFSFYVAETSGGSPTRKITINNNKIGF